ncbi:hypothetical protein DFJ58DRAFT_850590 [Suillus subalutaceus]|uniref:uncharacterized protein n=1 Tax=Suillus subalutaceus TaxID=48586 RepID=UPI001B884BF8|nr:uncharacterized protein DFJ58DRAFT_850590 [Suillus subalutaceus]KAG1814512.1 hypothetical protein DFJ58DRAFT_850590 [Suillus subalutaceus]
MANLSKFSRFSTAIEAGIINISKWYALDPNCKVAYAKDKWAPRFFKTGMQSRERVAHMAIVGCTALSKLRVMNDAATRRPRQELEDYLDAPLEDIKNVDYLAIQGSAVASEHTFSSGSITGTAHCGCLQPATFEALQLLKTAYHQGHISCNSPG